LATLVGPPGIGKSRLAVQVAIELGQSFRDGAYVVRLAPISDWTLVASSVAQVLGVPDPAVLPSPARLVEHLQDRQTLLLLDDFEHVLGAAPLIAEMLRACPGVKVLATSRAALHLRGERLIPVQPLAVPDPAVGRDPLTVGLYPSVELFVERAQAVNPEFEITEANAADVAAICAELDGLPLAIELVAARMTVLTPHALLPRLDHRLALLTDGPRDLPLHQQTLRRTLDWSYDLLSQGEQTLFARLAIFVDGCSLCAAEEVGNAMGDLPLTVLDGLTALADKNLLRQQERADGECSYVYFETIREYALERLAERGEELVVRGQFAEYHRRHAMSASHCLTGQQQETWLNRLEAEYSNFRSALEWYIGMGSPEPAQLMIGALWKFWRIHGHQSEARRWMDQILALDGWRNPEIRAKALYGSGWIALDQGDYSTARAWFGEGLALFRSLRDTRGVAEALHGVGIMAQAERAQVEAVRLFTESLGLYRDLHDQEGIAWSLDHLGRCALSLGDTDRAESLFGTSLTMFHEMRHSWGTAISLCHQGLAAFAQGRYGWARERIHDGLAVFQQLGNDWGIAMSLHHLGHLALAMGDLGSAEAHLIRCLALHQAKGDRDGVLPALVVSGCVAVAGRQFDRAACLFAAVEVHAEPHGVELDPVERALYERSLDRLRGEFARDALDRMWARGRTLSLTQVVGETVVHESA
jgi:predicted ATPase